MIRNRINPSLFIKFLGLLMIVLSSGCANNSMERNFFDAEYDQAGSRFDKYTIPEQIKIYLYGMQEVSPPITVLSRPIAEQGSAAIPYLLNTLNESPTDANIKDLMVVFETMQRLGIYDVSNDKQLLSTLSAFVTGMKNNIWRGYTQSTLTQIKKANREDDVQN